MLFTTDTMPAPTTPPSSPSNMPIKCLSPDILADEADESSLTHLVVLNKSEVYRGTNERNRNSRHRYVVRSLQVRSGRQDGCHRSRTEHQNQLRIPEEPG